MTNQLQSGEATMVLSDGFFSPDTVSFITTYEHFYELKIIPLPIVTKYKDLPKRSPSLTMFPAAGILP